MPDGLVIPGGPGFAGSPQPPDVPCDPTGEGWRGPPGPPGPAGPAGVGEAPVDTFAYGRLNATWARVLPLTGGNVSGTVTVGTASANYVQISGGAGAPGITTVGATTNVGMNVTGKGTGGVNLRSANGTILFAQDDGTGVIGNALTVLGGLAANPIKVNSNSPAGIDFNGPIQNLRTYTRAGLWNAAGTNYMGINTQTVVSGYALDTGQWPLNLLKTVDTVKATSGAIDFNVWPTFGAGHCGPRTGFWMTMNTTGAPYIPSAWQANHAYVLGDVVTNGGLDPAFYGNNQNVYQCIGAGTSAASGGPTGGNASITDGTAIWTYAMPFPELMYYVGGVFSAAAGYNAGGTAPTSSRSAGSMFGGNVSGRLNTGATNFNQCVGLEIDNMIATGASASVNVGLQIAHVETHAVQGAEIDVCLRLADQGVPGEGWRNMMVMGDYASQWPVDRNVGYLFQVQNNGARTPSAAGGFDLNMLQATGNGPEGGRFWWRSPGVKIRDTEVQAGYLSVATDANGAVIDASYSQMSAAAGAITVAASSSDWNQGDIAVDQYGNIVQVTAGPAPGGPVTGVSVILARGWQTTPPTNPVTFKSRTRGGPFFGTSLTLNLTWTARKGLSVQPSAGGSLGFYGAAPVAKQTGVPVTVAGVHAALTALGLIAP